jgi:hypothetical protein
VITLLAVRQYTSINFFLYGAVGTATCVAVGYLASCVIPAPRKALDGLTLYDGGARGQAHPVSGDAAAQSVRAP